MRSRMRIVALIVVAVLVTTFAVPSFASDYSGVLSRTIPRAARATAWEDVQESHPDVPVVRMELREPWTWQEIVSYVLGELEIEEADWWAYDPDGAAYDAVPSDEIPDGAHLAMFDEGDTDVCLGLWTMRYVDATPTPNPTASPTTSPTTNPTARPTTGPTTSPVSAWERIQNRYPDIPVQDLLLQSYEEGWTWREVTEYVSASMDGASIAWIAYTPAGGGLDAKDVYNEKVQDGSHLSVFDNDDRQKCLALWTIQFADDSSGDDKVTAWDLVQQNHPNLPVQTLILQYYPEGWTWDEVTDYLGSILEVDSIVWIAYSPAGVNLPGDVLAERAPEGAHIAVFDRDHRDTCLGLWTIGFSDSSSGDDKVTAWDNAQSTYPNVPVQTLLLEPAEEGWTWDQVAHYIGSRLEAARTAWIAYAPDGSTLSASAVHDQQVPQGAHIAVFDDDNRDDCLGLWTIQFSGSEPNPDTSGSWDAVQEMYPDVAVETVTFHAYTSGWTWEEVMNYFAARTEVADLAWIFFAPNGSTLDAATVIGDAVPEGAHLAMFDDKNHDTCLGLWTIAFSEDASAIQMPTAWDSTMSIYPNIPVQTLLLQYYRDGWTWDEVTDFVANRIEVSRPAWLLFTSDGTALSTNDVLRKNVPQGAHLAAFNTEGTTCLGLWTVQFGGDGAPTTDLSAWYAVLQTYTDVPVQTLLLKTYPAGWTFDEVKEVLVDHLDGASVIWRCYSSAGAVYGANTAGTEDAARGAHVAAFDVATGTQCLGLWTVQFGSLSSSAAHAKVASVTLTQLVRMAEDFVAGRNDVTLAMLVRATWHLVRN